ncbi:hypothetical protein HF1_07990 [Mycoplasma haemofelis str. Langford 1]|uniref:Uncharacterized protein n=1 Tax=Mycoplasma haemofelis (strain Langford 1) TaxID=941640 RepID=E8ZI36_MYCHL|nr:hypothetical protein HF1_07990 [Mycoplasma haemofelis str. Langford 1]
MANPALVKFSAAALSTGGAGVVGWQIVNHLNKGEDKTEVYLTKQGRERASSSEEWRVRKDKRILCFWRSTWIDSQYPKTEYTNRSH